MGEANTFQETGSLKVGLYVALFVVTVLVLKKYASGLRKNLPPSPPRLPIVGHLHLLGGGKPLHQILATMAEKYGPIMYLKLGSSPTIVISSAKAAEECINGHDAIFSGRPPLALVTCLIYDGQDIVMRRRANPEWRHLRKLMTFELLTAKRLKATQHVRNTEISLLKRSIFLETRGQINLREKFFLMSFNIVSLMALKKRVLSSDSDPVDVHTISVQSMADMANFKYLITQAFKVAGTICLQDFFPIFKYFDVQGSMAEMKSIHKKLDNVFQRIIDEHRERKATRDGSGEEEEEDMVDVLLNSQKASDINIKTTLMNAYLGSTETMMTTLEWTMTEILRNPEIMERAQLELDIVVGQKRNVMESDIPKLVYLHSIFCESFRLHAPGPLFFRETTENCTIAGYDVPKETRVLFSPYAIGRDSRHWKDPLKFNPDRFMINPFPDEGFRGQDFRIIPFGAGKRICPGINMAVLVMKNVLANLLHGFHWTADVDKLDISEAVSFSNMKAISLFATAKARLSKELY